MTTSIMIPFYAEDAELGFALLRSTLESVQAQTVESWTVTVMDNCSPIAGAREFVESFKDARIRYRCNARNLGFAGNLNECAALAESELYMLLHADDELMPHYLAHMTAFADEHPDAAAVFCPADIIDENGVKVWSFVEFVKARLVNLKKIITLRGDAGLATLMRGNFIMAPTALYRRSKVRDVLFTDRWKWIPDFSYWASLLLKGHTLVGTPKVCFRYRRHSKSITGVMTKRIEMFEEEADFFQFVRQGADEKHWLRTVSVARRKSIVKLRTAYFLLQDLGAFNWTASKDKSRLLVRLFAG